MKTPSDIARQWPLRPKENAAINVAAVPVRYRAASMELAAYPDEQHVEMHILTDTGKAITIVCDKNSIFSIQRHIEQMGRACPEISTWTPVDDGNSIYGGACRSYEAAVWEGWPLSQSHGH